MPLSPAAELELAVAPGKKNELEPLIMKSSSNRSAEKTHDILQTSSSKKEGEHTFKALNKTIKILLSEDYDRKVKRINFYIMLTVTISMSIVIASPLLCWDKVYYKFQGPNDCPAGYWLGIINLLVSACTLGFLVCLYSLMSLKMKREFKFKSRWEAFQHTRLKYGFVGEAIIIIVQPFPFVDWGRLESAQGFVIFLALFRIYHILRLVRDFSPYYTLRHRYRAQNNTEVVITSMTVSKILLKTSPFTTVVTVVLFVIFVMAYMFQLAEAEILTSDEHSGVVEYVRSLLDPALAANGITDTSNFVQGDFKEYFAGALYFTIVTATTAGFGDVTPQTYVGKLYAVMCMILGLLLAALIVKVLMDFLTPKPSQMKLMEWVRIRNLRGQRRVVATEIIQIAWKYYQKKKATTELGVSAFSSMNEGTRMLYLRKKGAKLKTLLQELATMQCNQHTGIAQDNLHHDIITHSDTTLALTKRASLASSVSSDNSRATHKRKFNFSDVVKLRLEQVDRETAEKKGRKIYVVLCVLSLISFALTVLRTEYCLDRKLLIYTSNCSIATVTFYFSVALSTCMLSLLSWHYFLETKRKKMEFHFQTFFSAFLKSRLYQKYIVELILLIAVPEFATFAHFYSLVDKEEFTFIKSLSRNPAFVLVRLYLVGRVVRDFSEAYTLRHLYRKEKKHYVKVAVTDVFRMRFSSQPSLFVCSAAISLILLLSYILWYVERQTWNCKRDCPPDLVFPMDGTELVNLAGSRLRLQQYLETNTTLTVEINGQNVVLTKGDFISFSNCVWFTITTMTTVGYGRYVPYSNTAKFWSYGMEVIGIVVASLLISEVVNSLTPSPVQKSLILWIHWGQLEEQKIIRATCIIQSWFRSIRQKKLLAKEGHIKQNRNAQQRYLTIQLYHRLTEVMIEQDKVKTDFLGTR
mmetsp:Transcript_33103/g.64936  ORF Transcript_33103/g.64936 Transcript_33103/m.64936 type:complete len:920 (+) Transcript_33103:51-2810(+)|eukprot:CAMPEP_0175138926 /NCGR_PEP_ID=MMETSP0087-20121206/10615_1 /TAXON_ID=136419 /ORGANISM="Unknown Unknown, Strain D1" /LENGTH=919 /DNA_ID=CAMNT_0016421873 /DNA_START=36 /DNA_END=2795 /DNA_ORIENTATION=+